MSLGGGEGIRPEIWVSILVQQPVDDAILCPLTAERQKLPEPTCSTRAFLNSKLSVLWSRMKLNEDPKPNEMCIF